MGRRSTGSLLFITTLSLACGGQLNTDGRDDAGTIDSGSGSADASVLDARLVDGPALDAAASDAHLPDAVAIDANLCGNPSVIPSLAHGTWNPLLTPRAATAAHGSDNIYAADIIKVSSNLCLMWYGGQGSDGHDRIFLATSTDCQHWHHYPADDAPEAVIDSASSNHVNDPSVVAVGGTYYLYYTDAATGIDDRIHLATSSDGVTFTKQGLVIDVGGAGSWDDFKVGRPAVLHIGATFYLWYDGNDGASRHVGLATSSNGTTFTKHPANPLVLNAGAVDVELVDGTYIMVREAGDGVYASTSADGSTWCDQGKIANLSGGAWDQHGHVTPFIHAASTDFDALFVGGASDACWCKNRIGALYPSGYVFPADPSTGCSNCIGAHADCSAACRAATLGVEGYCAVPGSTDPGNCCACVPLP
jgi:predicted GH43/DUF377 family glycosyl hydrolase